MILVSSLIFSAIGSLFMELGTGVLGRSSRTMWFLLWILFSLTVAYAPKKRKREDDEKGKGNTIGKNRDYSDTTTGYIG